VPATIARSGERADWQFPEFFTADIRNKNTRAAYAEFELLEQSLLAVLDNAREVANTWGENHINPDAVKESIKHYSPYFPWR
jgi:hypothetical protein